MGSRWRRIKAFLSARTCSITPTDHHHLENDGSTRSDWSPEQLHIANDMAMTGPVATGSERAMPVTLNAGTSTPNTTGTVLNSARLSRSSCSICLEAMKPGQGQALFTAECSHTFHFSCIVSNVRHGNQICPVCRAKWKDVPWQAAPDSSKSPTRRHGRTPSVVPRSLSRIGRLGSSHVADEEQRRSSNLFHLFDESIAHGPIREPDIYDDDEPLMQPSRDLGNQQATSSTISGCNKQKVEIKTYSEVDAVPACESWHNFTILVHVKAPPASRIGSERREVESSNISALSTDVSSRAPIDLVAVLDISGSMAGTKLALLKQAMGFVVHNLSTADRLSVVVFSSTARRIFPLQRMGEEGQRLSLQSIDSLVSTGGTNIAEGLRKGVKVLEDRKERNPVSSIMLLSDGQDTYSLSSRRQLPFFLSRGLSDSRRLVPRSIRRSAFHGHMQIPVHTFGFGSDHDAATMHTIAEVSGGTFSFIQAEGVVQDAFAQCIGGLLSVVIQDVQLTVSCSSPGVLINNIKAGSYESSILESARHGIVKLGDLYAEEERDVLLELELPCCPQAEVDSLMALVQAGCMCKDPVTQDVNQSTADELCISRPLTVTGEQKLVSLEVDRQRNRLRTAEAIAEARSLADQGDILAAQSNLQNAKSALENSISARAGDHLSGALEAELSEIQERMANQQLYERSGRAYLLSAQSSHQRQRATTRGESLDGLNHDYQTQSMVDMITQSQTMSFVELSGSGANPFAVRSNQGNGANAPNSGRALLRRASAIVRKSG